MRPHRIKVYTDFEHPTLGTLRATDKVTISKRRNQPISWSGTLLSPSGTEFVSTSFSNEIGYLQAKFQIFGGTPGHESLSAIWSSPHLIPLTYEWNASEGGYDVSTGGADKSFLLQKPDLSRTTFQTTSSSVVRSSDIIKDLCTHYADKESVDVTIPTNIEWAGTFWDPPIREFQVQNTKFLDRILELLDLNRSIYYFDSAGTMRFTQPILKKETDADWTYVDNLNIFQVGLSMNTVDKYDAIELTNSGKNPVAMSQDFKTIGRITGVSLGGDLIHVEVKAVATNCHIVNPTLFDNDTIVDYIIDEPLGIHHGTGVYRFYNVLKANKIDFTLAYTDSVPLDFNLHLEAYGKDPAFYNSVFGIINDSFTVTVPSNASTSARKKKITISLLPNQDYARALGELMLAELGSHVYSLTFKIPFNPWLEVGQTVKIVDTRGETTGVYLVEEVDIESDVDEPSTTFKTKRYRT